MTQPPSGLGCGQVPLPCRRQESESSGVLYGATLRLVRGGWLFISVAASSFRVCEFGLGDRRSKMLLSSPKKKSEDLPSQKRKEEKKPRSSPT